MSSAGWQVCLPVIATQEPMMIETSFNMSLELDKGSVTNSPLTLKASRDISVKRSHKAMLYFKWDKEVQANIMLREELEYLWTNTSNNHSKPLHLLRTDQDHWRFWTRLFTWGGRSSMRIRILGNHTVCKEVFKKHERVNQRQDKMTKTTCV